MTRICCEMLVSQRQPQIQKQTQGIYFRLNTNKCTQIFGKALDEGWQHSIMISTQNEKKNIGQDCNDPKWIRFTEVLAGGNSIYDSQGTGSISREI